MSVDTFCGFRHPGHTPIPNEALDELLSELSGSQFKVLMAIARRCLGWKKIREQMEFVPASIAELQAATNLSKEVVVDAIAYLHDHKMIMRQKRRRDDGRAATTAYRLRFFNDVDQEISEPESEFPTLAEGARVGNLVGFSDSGFTMDEGKPLGRTTTVKEKEINKTSNTPLPPAELQNAPPPAETPEPEQPTELESSRPSDVDELSTSLSGMRRRTKAGRIKGKELAILGQGLPSLLGDYSAGEIERGFAAFLADEFWAEKKFPVQGFLKQASKYIGQRSSSGERHAIAAPAPIPQHPPIQPAASTPDFPARWNAAIPERPIDPALLPPSPRAYREAAFVERFDAICAASRQLISAGADLTFDFLLSTDARSGGQYRWQQLLAGRLNWMKPKTNGNSEKAEMERQLKELGII